MLYKKEAGESETNYKLRFNYMGEISDYKHFKMIFEKDTGPDSDSKNMLDVSMEINLLIVRGMMYCCVNYDSGIIEKNYLKRFCEAYEGQVKSMIELFKSMDKQILTPSDFEFADISQEDLDQLFL